MSLIKANLPAWSTLTDFFEDDWMKPRLFKGDWLPAVNVLDNEKDYEIEVAAPGFKKEDFKVEIDNNVLYISAKMEKEEKEENKNYTRKEFSSKAFTKSFTLPENVMEGKIEAKYTDGVLKIMLKKMKLELPPKKAITIKQI